MAIGAANRICNRSVARRWLAIAAMGFGMASCGDRSAKPQDAGAPPKAAALEKDVAPDAAADDARQDAADAVETAARATMMAPATGDLDELVKRRYIRVLVPLSRSLYYLDRGQQFGLSYDAGKLFEESLNKRLGSGVIKVTLAFLPVARERMLPMLAEGRGDLAMGNLTVTDERARVADFAEPFLTGVREIVVTAKDQPPPKSVDDLAGREIHVRKSSSYYGSLVALNGKLKAAGKEPVRIVEAPADLEDEDLLEMVDAGLIPATVVDDHVAAMWKDVYDDLRVCDGVSVHDGGSIAWAVRKDCPKLLAEVSAFAKENRKGSLHFNMLYKKYLKGGKKLERAADSAETKKFVALIDTFRKYGEQYDVPWLLVGALSYQESRFDQSARSKSGAVGVMQLLPTTAAGPPVQIDGVETSIDANVHAGTKYLRFIADKHVNEPELDRLTRGLFVLASYNAGPSRIAKLRKKAAAMDLDPNRWFGNVEVVVAKDIGRETVQYVSNIYKYYVTYGLIVDRMVARGELKGD
jgi:membrane-bound lytic murein transglycosylase MltF